MDWQGLTSHVYSGREFFDIQNINFDSAQLFLTPLRNHG
jgi:hypothetical protein